LQVWSKTIRAALARYNTAAKALKRRTLTWTEVIEYAFLSDFDILRDATGNAALRPWAEPAARQLLDTYFRIERAKEEIPRLNIEIRRLVTHIRDEREFLVGKEAEVLPTDPNLAFFIHKYRLRRGRFDVTHLKRLQTMATKLGPLFTGTLVPGVRRTEEELEVEEMEVDPPAEDRAAAEAEAITVSAEIERADVEDDWEDMVSDDEDYNEGEIAEGETLAEITEQVLSIANDASDE
jgi:hypothetical protein